MLFLGIDQTGAVDSRGRPKPLPACLLDGNKFELFLLKSFDLESLARIFPIVDPSHLLICLDCVIGLPSELDLTWRTALQMTLQHEGYGRVAAQKFFRTLGHGTNPRRKVELLCKANSIFQEHPFQKNIQTGTFRFWKEMAQNPHWFYAPWILNEVATSRIPIIEGYPSLAWKLLFQVPVRQPKQLKQLLLQFYPKLLWSSSQQMQVEQNPNFADALVLALAAKQYYLKESRYKPSLEGWILGA